MLITASGFPFKKELKPTNVSRPIRAWITFPPWAVIFNPPVLPFPNGDFCAGCDLWVHFLLASIQDSFYFSLSILLFFVFKFTII
jgi:hypothetical protein